MFTIEIGYNVDNDEEDEDRWRRAFNEADTIFIELLDHHLRHPGFDCLIMLTTLTLG